MAPATRPPPPQGTYRRPPPYAFVSRVYKRSLRPVVIACCTVGCIWTLIWAVGAFQDIGDYKEFLPRFKSYDLALGIMYATTSAIELYGIVSAWLAKLSLVRIYTYGSVLSALLVTAAELMRTILHFVFKNQLINECVRISTDKTITGSGFWGATTETVLSQPAAEQWCTESWSRATFSDLAWLIVATILGWMFSSIAFSYYHQLLDPTSVASRYPNAPPDQYHMQTYPTGSYGNAPFPQAQSQEYVPPYDSQKPPGYSNAGGYGASAEKDHDDNDHNGPSKV